MTHKPADELSAPTLPRPDWRLAIKIGLKTHTPQLFSQKPTKVADNSPETSRVADVSALLTKKVNVD
jgi:hypothetical protein